MVDEYPQFELGQRVAVHSNWNWPDSPTGTIAEPMHPMAGSGWGPLYRTSLARGKRERSYWVEFDAFQQDSDGDGPYVSGEVYEQNLVKI